MTNREESAHSYYFCGAAGITGFLGAAIYCHLQGNLSSRGTRVYEESIAVIKTHDGETFKCIVSQRRALLKLDKNLSKNLLQSHTL